MNHPQPTTSTFQVFTLITDLVARDKVRSAIESLGGTHTYVKGNLPPTTESVAGLDLVIIDLALKVGDPIVRAEEFRYLGITSVWGFYPHVEHAMQARAEGSHLFSRILPRSKFFTRLPELLSEFNEERRRSEEIL